MKSANDRLIERIRRLPKVQVQNTLMRLTDREIALSMRFMEDRDRSFVFSLLPGGKADRIREELKLHTRLRITMDQYQRVVGSLQQQLAGTGARESTRSYIRPRR